MSLASQTYKVQIADNAFNLTYSQCLTDSPNYFSAAFLGDWVEGETALISLDRSPELFAIIYDYLKGYDILPLSPHSIPARWTLEATLSNLLKDAMFYGLDGLVELLTPATPEPVQEPTIARDFLPPLDFARGSWSGATPILCGPYMLDSKLPEEVVYGDKGLVFRSTAALENPTAPVFKVQDVHIALTIDARLNTVRMRWTCLHPKDMDDMLALLPNGTPMDLNTGCAAGSITRQILLEASSRNLNFDNILVWASSKLPNASVPASETVAADNNHLDTLFCVNTPLASPEEGIRVACVAQTVMFALYHGSEGAYIAPLFISAQPLMTYWASMR